MDFVDGKLLRIFLDENDRAGMQPTYTAVVEFLRRNGVRGATVFRGVEGFGGHGKIHQAKAFSWLPNLPIVIEVVETEDAIERILPQLETMIQEGLITIEAARYLRRSA